MIMSGAQISDFAGAHLLDADAQHRARITGRYAPDETSISSAWPLHGRIHRSCVRPDGLMACRLTSSAKSDWHMLRV